MGEQKNLTEENVDELREQLEAMKETNPDLEYRFMEQIENAHKRHDEIEDVVPDESQAKEEWLTLGTVFDKLLEIERKLDRIFGEHVLINGSFQDITKKVATK